MRDLLMARSWRGALAGGGSWWSETRSRVEDSGGRACFTFQVPCRGWWYLRNLIVTGEAALGEPSLSYRATVNYRMAADFSEARHRHVTRRFPCQRFGVMDQFEVVVVNRGVYQCKILCVLAGVVVERA